MADDGEDLHEDYEAFHWGDEAEEVSRHDVPPQLERGIAIGTLVSVVYRTSKGGEDAEWEHEFGEDGGDPPLLVLDQRTGELHIVGGTYRVTTRGIEG